MIQPGQGFSRKLTSLTDFEYRVFEQVKLCSDDFGVMPYTPAHVRSQNRRLRRATESVVLSALRQIVSAGIYVVFEHQDEQYLCHRKWQEHQTIDYPRVTHYPKPPADVLARLTPATQYLFQFHPGGVKLPPKKDRPKFQTDSGITPEPFLSERERTPANAHANAKTSTDDLIDRSREDPPPPRPGSRLDRRSTLVRPRDLHAFFEGPVFNIPQKWADSKLTQSNGALTEGDLSAFARALSAEVERTGEDVTAGGNLLAWLDGKLKTWRASRAEARDHDRMTSAGLSHLAQVRRLERGE